MYIVLRNDYTVVSCHDCSVPNSFVVDILPAGERPTDGLPVIHLLLDSEQRLMAAYWREEDCLACCVDGLTCATFFVN